MANPHFEIKITKRSKRQSAVAGAAYQSGENLFSEYDQKHKDYRKKEGVVYTEIMLPSHAPPEYADREQLWNAVEAVENQWNSQLARRFVLALPREVPEELYPQMVQDYCNQFFVSKGMIADFAIHDPKPPGHNPHCHVMLTMRAMDEHGKNLLLTQEEKEAQYIATALEIYVSGSLNVFNHRTNVNIQNRIVCYDIKELGKQLKKIGMLVVQDQVWNRVTINRAAHKSTRYYIDEMHLLLKEDQTAAYTIEIWKRFRKWGGIPTGITQNIKDLLASREITNIFENSDFVYMLNQASGDRQILARQLGISPHQLSYVTHSGEGEGLLFYGNIILPFVDRFPKNTELYRIMTTKLSDLSEVKQLQEQKEEPCREPPQKRSAGDGRAR